MEISKKIQIVSISKKQTVLFALKRMDELGVKLLLLVSENGKFDGLITIGDIQRAIIANKPLSLMVENIVRKEVHFARTTDTLDKVRKNMLREKDECMPIVDTDGFLHDVIFWNDLFEEAEKEKKLKGIPVIIMAGGLGSRMKPLTNVIPKPLIPVGDKTIAENIIDRFCEYGCSQFYFSVNYKAGLIKYYFDQIEKKNFDISYFQEDKPLGTAGSLSLLKGEFSTPIFVTNCDVIIIQNYNDILDFHVQNKNDITIVSSLKSIYLPYGTLESGEKGELFSMKEKPEFTFMINTGMYILQPEVLNNITDNEFLHITTLIENIKNSGGKVGVFPVSEKQYYDIGEWQGYIDTIARLEKSKI